MTAVGRATIVKDESTPANSGIYRSANTSLETGKRLGEVKSRRSHASFFVLGNTLVYESPAYAWRDGGEMVRSPRELRAIDLWRGTDLWSRPLGDTAFRGQRPQ